MTTHIHYPNYPVTPAIKAIYRASNNNLTTFRKNGIPVSTPVSCAEHDGIIYFATGADSGKVKRIRHTTHITLAPCTPRGRETGDAVEAHARIITEVAETYKAKGALQSKYGLRRQIIYVIMKMIQLVRKQPETQQVYVAIEFSHEHPHN
jgi:PPOX class probable F420-dependent enzyme